MMMMTCQHFPCSDGFVFLFVAYVSSHPSFLIDPSSIHHRHDYHSEDHLFHPSLPHPLMMTMMLTMMMMMVREKQ